jgi:membrane protease YdiL (CAAX protease family)
VTTKINSVRWPGFAPALGDRRVLHPGRWRPLRALAWMLALFFAVSVPFGLWADAADSVLPTTPAGTFTGQLIGALILLALYAAVVALGEGRPASELGPRSALAGLGAGLVIGLLMMALVMAILGGTGLYDITFLGPAPAWGAAGLAVQAGVFEELLVRGILLRLVWRAFGPWVAFVVSAVAFGVGHLANPEGSIFAALCIALEAGIMLGAFYALTGRLWVSIGVHTAWNFAQGYLFGAAVSGGDTGASIARSTARPDAAAWLTGGAFGPEASLPAVVVCTAVGAAVLVLAWRLGRFREVA